MHRKYFLRKNYKAVCSDGEQQILGHMAFKTKDALWVDTTMPSVALISVHSAFHQGIEGRLKMEAFLSVIRSSIRSSVTVLIADTAHLETRRLLEGYLAHANCLKDAKDLISHYESVFAGCKLIYWHDLKKKEEFSLLRSEILNLSKKDAQFQKLLEYDAQNDWNQKRQNLYPNQEIFIEKSIEDLIDQCVCLQLLARQGYGYLFYPGAPHHATVYLEAQMPSRIEWINVFLTIEKKTRLNMTLI